LMSRYFKVRQVSSVGQMSVSQNPGNDWGWGSEEQTARAVCVRYIEAGGNFIDTADLYIEGHSEELLGKFIGERALRDRVVPATKFTFNPCRAIRTRAATAARISTGRSRPGSGDSKLTTLISTGCMPGTALKSESS